MNAADPALPSFIGRLPQELLEAIVEQLEVRRGPLVDPQQEHLRGYENELITSSLRALTLTCRNFKAIATSILYRCLILSKRPVRHTKLLMHTLHNQQALCRHIEYIENPEIRGPAFSYLEDIKEGFTASERSSLNQYLRQATWAETRPDCLITVLNDT
jgi:hypothetical protein